MKLRCHLRYIIIGIFSGVLLLYFFAWGPRMGFCYYGGSEDRPLNYALEWEAETTGGAGWDSAVFAQMQDRGPELDWERRYIGPLDDTIRFVQQTADGGYIMVGETCLPGNDGSDIQLIKINASGAVTWQKSFGREGNDFGRCVRETPGGYVLAGSTEIPGTGSYDVYLIRTDASGNKLWEKTYGGPADDYGRSVWVNKDGTMLIAGETRSFGAGGSGIYLIKVDASGVELWSKCISGGNDDWAETARTISDGIIIAGGTKTFGAGMSDAYLVKTDANGNKLWHRTFGGPADDRAYDLQQTTDGGFIIAGATASFGGGGIDAYLIKADSTGNKQWEKYYGGEADDWARSVRQTTDGGYLLGGSAKSFGLGDSDYYLVKTGAAGELIWEKTRGEGENANGNCAIQTNDGGFLLAGEASSGAVGYSDGWVVKYKAGEVMGDMNGDYAVDLQDLLWMSRWLGAVGCAESQEADFNHDGQVNILDLLQVYNLIGQEPISGDPVIYEILPPSGKIGTSVEILGRGFGPSQGSSTIAFNGLNAPVTAWSDSRIEAEVPPGATGGSVVVTVAGRPSNGIYFEVITGNETVLESQTGTAGPGGGMLTFGDGTCLLVSPGVLETEISITLCQIANEKNFSGPYWRAYEVRGAFDHLPAYLAVPAEKNLALDQIGVYYYDPVSGEGIRPSFDYFPQTGNIVVSLLGRSNTAMPAQFVGKSLNSAGSQDGKELFPGYRVIVEVGDRFDAPYTEKIIKMPFYQQVAGISWAADAAMLGKAFTPYSDRGTEIETYDYLKCLGAGLVNNNTTWVFKHRLNQCFHSLTGVEAGTCNWLSPGNLREFMRTELDEGNPMILRYPDYSLLVLGYRDYREGSRRVLDFYVHDSRGVDSPSATDGTMYTWRNYQDWLEPRLTAEPDAINSVLLVRGTPPHPSRALQTLSPTSMTRPGELRFECENQQGAVVRAWLGFSESEPKGYAWYVGPFSNGTRIDLIPAQSGLRLALNAWNADLSGSAATDIEVKIFQTGCADPLYSYSGNLVLNAHRNPVLFVHNVPSCAYKSDSGSANYTLRAELYKEGVYQDGFAVDFTLDEGPVICSVSPDSGEAGSQVTINGFGFGAVQDISTVTFNGVLISGESILSWSSESIVVKVPDKTMSGDLRVTVNGKISNRFPFTFQ